MRTHSNHRSSIALAALLSTCLLSACGKEVCKKDVGPVAEVTVKFKGFSLGQAVTLEIDSTVTGPVPPKATKRYYSRRISRMAFPESARDGSATFIFEPGSYIMSLKERSGQEFTMVVWLRVYGATGQLLAEGRYGFSGTTRQCWLNQSMTVGTGHTCVGKVEGDACTSRGETPYVCRGPQDNLVCEESSCGDGFVDAQNGEACDTADASSVPCAQNCLPAFVDRTIWEPGPQWHEVDTQAPSPRFLASGAVHDPSGGPATFVLFGGQDENLQPLQDTWLFDGVEWSPYAEGTQPPARFGHTMAYDPDREVVLLFGGTNDATTNPAHAQSFDDLWEFHPDTGWAERAPTGDLPEPRFGAAMAYQPGIGSLGAGLVLFGGYLGPPLSPQPDPSRKTFHLVWDTGSGDYVWSDVGSPASVLPASPNGIRHHTLTWVPALGQLLLVGGQDATGGDSRKNVYQFTGTQWTASTSLPNAAERSRHQAVVVPDLDNLVLVGGSSDPEAATGGDRYRSLMDLRPSGWASVYPSNVPPPRTGHVAFYLPGPDALFTFGGRIELEPVASSPLALANDTWLLHTDAAPANPFLSPANLKIGISHQTDTRGFYDLGRGDPTEASLDVVAFMTLADFDGDGAEEIAMGFPGGNHLGAKLGSVLVDDPNPSDRTVSYTNALQIIVGVQLAANWPWGSWLGGSVGAGDFTGDGAADLVLGAATRESINTTTDTTSGAIYIIKGGASGSIAPDNSSTKPLQVATGASAGQHFAIYGETGGGALNGPSDRFGYALAVGDFDGDGREDIAVGAPERSDSGASTGAVYILSGAGLGTWPTGAGPRAVNELDLAPLTLRSTTVGLRLGVSLAAGDVDGDGVTDLVVGSATTSGDATCSATTPSCGAFVILYGQEGLFGNGGRELSAEALSPSDGALARAADDDSLFGLGGVVAVVDLDSDGRGEVVSSLGRPDPRGGGPYGIAIFRGMGLPAALGASSEAAQATHLVLTAPSAATRSGFGAFLAAGDVNGDRKLDLLVGAPFEGMVLEDLPQGTMFHPVQNAGALYVLLGSRLADYWNPMGDNRTELAVDEVMGWSTNQAVTFPLIRVRGSLAEGFLGASTATSSHFSHVDPTLPRSHTLLFHPGWFLLDNEAAYRDRYEGRVYTVNLQDLLR